MFTLPNAEFFDRKPYYEAVKHLFDTQSNLIFKNSNVGHASTIITEVFDHATTIIRVFCRKLNVSVWGDQRLKDAIQQAVSRNVKIEIVTQLPEKDVDVNSIAFFKHIGVHPQYGIGRDRKYNFVVADNKMFRLEPNADDIGAFASANNKEVSTKLEEIFAEIQSEKCIA